MQTLTTSENQQTTQPCDLGQICKEHATPPEEGSREHVELRIQETASMSLSRTIEHLNGLERGAYRVSIRASSEWNEITVRLYESTIRNPVACGYVDRGHTADTKREAAEELRGIVLAYLCRDPFAPIP